eukprot:15013049-Alexandrium_andersonii.AAC.1
MEAQSRDMGHVGCVGSERGEVDCGEKAASTTNGCDRATCLQAHLTLTRCLRVLDCQVATTREQQE